MIDNVPISLLMDGEEIEIDTSGFFTEIQLSKGEHTISSGGVYPETIRVTGDGLITSEKSTFYKYPVDYVADEKPKDPYSIQLDITGPIMIGDSIVVFKSSEFSSLEVLTTRLKGMVKKTENGKYKQVNKAIASNDLFLKLNGKSNFIKKNWDYNVDNIPEEITLYEGNAETKSMMLPGDFVSMYALFDESMKLETIPDQESLEIIKAYIAMKHELIGY